MSGFKTTCFTTRTTAVCCVIVCNFAVQLRTCMRAHKSFPLVYTGASASGDNSLPLAQAMPTTYLATVVAATNVNAYFVGGQCEGNTALAAVRAFNTFP